MNKPLRISLASTCMNRLVHIRKTLIKNIESNRTYGDVEFVLLDYNSQDGLEGWIRRNCRSFIEEGLLKYYRTTEPTFFHHAHAKNMAALLSTGDVVVNVDADNYTGLNFALITNRMFSSGLQFTACNPRGFFNGCAGRIGMSRKDFIGIGGYEERIVGWGMEDPDLRFRCKKLKLRRGMYEATNSKCIDHNNEMRTAHHLPASVKETTSQSEFRNRAIYDEHRRNGTTVGNVGRVWGRGLVAKNFQHRFDVGSDIPEGFCRERPKKAALGSITPRVFHPMPLSKRHVGHFVISPVHAKQVNTQLHLGQD